MGCTSEGHDTEARASSWELQYESEKDEWKRFAKLDEVEKDRGLFRLMPEPPGFLSLSGTKNYRCDLGLDRRGRDFLRLLFRGRRACFGRSLDLRGRLGLGRCGGRCSRFYRWTVSFGELLRLLVRRVEPRARTRVARDERQSLPGIPDSQQEDKQPNHTSTHHRGTSVREGLLESVVVARRDQAVLAPGDKRQRHLRPVSGGPRRRELARHAVEGPHCAFCAVGRAERAETGRVRLWVGWKSNISGVEIASCKAL